MPPIHPPNSNIRINVLNKLDSPCEPKLGVDVGNPSEEEVLRQSCVHIEILGELPEHEKETVLHKPTATDIKLSHSASVRLFNDIKEPEPLGVVLHHRSQIQNFIVSL